MIVATTRSRRRIAGIALVPIAAVVLGACGPAPAPAPPKPPTVQCNVGPANFSDGLEMCHSNYRAYYLDTLNSFAQDKANSLIGMTPSQCSSALASFHTPGWLLLAQYSFSSMVAENLYCLYYSGGGCPTPGLGATAAMNGWLASAGHKANMDNFAGKWVNAAAVCRSTSQGGTGVYVAVAQFHN